MRVWGVLQIICTYNYSREFPAVKKIGNSVFLQFWRMRARLAIAWPFAGGRLVPGGMEEGQQQGEVLIPVGC